MEKASACEARKCNPRSRGKAQTCFVAPHMSWSWMWMQRVGAMVAVNVARVSRSRSLHPVCCGGRYSMWGHGCGLHTRGMGLQSPSMHRVCHGHSLHALCIVVAGVVCGVAVVVFVPCASWSWVCCIQLWLWVPSLHCMCHGTCLCAVCGVTVALFTLRGVSPVPSLHQVWCCSCGHHATRGVCGRKRGSDGAARRDAAMWCMQLGKGTMRWGHVHVVVVVGNNRAGLLRQFFVECHFV